MKRLVISLSLLLVCSVANAHFPWLMVDKDGNAEFFFGEGITDRTYKLPEGIAKAEIMMRANGKTIPVETKVFESDDFVGKKSITSIPADADLVSQATYGVYHGGMLKYYTQHLGGEMPTEFSSCKPFEKMDLQAHAVDTDSGVEVYVLWKGKPLEGADVKLFCEDGHEEGNGSTDASGKVFFNDKEVEDGMNAIMVGHTLTGVSGTLGDQEYTSAMHYLTATFVDPEDN
ncbi:MAG: hypothetical protein AAF802_23300 [Planctomycetota bacterium]